MFDGSIRVKIDPLLMWMAKKLVALNINANQVTVFSFFIGMLAAVLIAYHSFWIGLILLLLSRLGDGLDGSIAKLTKSTDYGGFLDIVLDFAFYGAIPLGFIFASLEENGLAGAVLIFSFYVNGASFLAYAIMAEKRGAQTQARGKKSIFYTTGLAEATETIVFFVASCVFPNWFSIFAWVFAAVVFYTAFSRIMLAKSELAD
ncbi:MAG: CDP-alcohol phosphatidyltransferase family protein [Rhizobiales bacterium]|nr:CDP-alcohol phosphatidyltransferase family protein [Hyphomicrobiales bacterium]